MEAKLKRDMLAGVSRVDIDQIFIYNTDRKNFKEMILNYIDTLIQFWRTFQEE
jgi:hypothetical protein